MKIKVFISYSENDGDKVEKLVSQLKNNNLDVWFDQEQLYPGEELKPAIKNGIYSANIFLACLSSNYVNNFSGSWTERELKIATQNEEKQNVRKIIPVRFEKAKGNQLPDILGKRAFADLSSFTKWEKNFNRLVDAIKKTSLEQKKRN